MLEAPVVIAVSLCYLGLLFAVAWWGDKRADQGKSIIANPTIYALSMAVYCTTWTFYGSVGRAAVSGIGFLPGYLGTTLVMACVVIVQGLVFCDGGLVVMGANICNMGIVGTLGGYAVYRALCRLLGGEDRGRVPAAAIAGWLSVMGAAVMMSLQLIVSGTSPAEIVLPAMLGVHLFIGIGEALITGAAVAFIATTRRDLLDLRPDRAARLAAGQGAMAA